MDIFDLEKEQKILEAKITSKKERIELERSRLGSKAVDYSKPVVQSSPHKDPLLDVFARISEMENDVAFLIAELEQNQKEVNRLYNIFKDCKDRDKQIYIEKKLYKWSNAKISMKHGGISKWTIKRSINKIEKAMNGELEKQ